QGLRIGRAGEVGRTEHQVGDAVEEQHEDDKDQPGGHGAPAMSAGYQIKPVAPAEPRFMQREPGDPAGSHSTALLATSARKVSSRVAWPEPSRLRSSSSVPSA